MMPISGVSSGPIRPLAAAGDAAGASKVRQAGEEPQRRPLGPVTDQYVPEEKREPSGLYRLGRDGEGQPTVFFDSPEPPAGPSRPGGPGAGGPEDAEERWVCSTDKVDHEIERLRREKMELEQRLHTEPDGAAAKDLERRLAQVERELCAKDNDAYRRRHAALTRLS